VVVTLQIDRLAYRREGTLQYLRACRSAIRPAAGSAVFAELQHPPNLFDVVWGAKKQHTGAGCSLIAILGPEKYYSDPLFKLCLAPASREILQFLPVAPMLTSQFTPDFDEIAAMIRYFSSLLASNSDSVVI
jgi:hypothetical protein